MKKNDDYLNMILKEFSMNTNLGRCISQIEKMNTENSWKLYREKYFPIIQEQKKLKTRNPFLSVVIRTQGKREEGLREALLCLNAQSNQDFEVILIAHKVNKEQEKIVQEILEEQEESFRNKIRYVKLDYGTRTTPLNIGFSYSWGKYIAVFDDDDILFDNWVESFWNCAKENEGRILHSYAFAQDWENIENIGYSAVSAPIPNYCVEYDMLAQLTVNRCPLMTLAFPANIFQQVGIIFNEELNVTEDWEYFSRLAFLCGVSDEKEPTAIYRFWKNIETSATLHNQDDWTETYHKIQESFNEYDIVLPRKNVKRIIDLLVNNNIQTENDAAWVSHLYYSKGQSFDNLQRIKGINKKNIPEIDIWFLFDEKPNNLTALRFDLSEHGMVAIKDLKIDMWFTNGEKKELTLENCITNGIELKETIFFVKDDPEIVWSWNDERYVDVVHISGSLVTEFPKSSIVDYLLNLFPVKKIKEKREMHRKGYF